MPQFLRSVLTNSAAAFSIVAAAAFCMLQIAQSLFYDHFDLSAEMIDSGGFPDALFRQIAPVNLAALVCVGAMALAGARRIAAASWKEAETLEKISRIDEEHRLLGSVSQSSATRQEAAARELARLTAQRAKLKDTLPNTEIDRRRLTRSGYWMLGAAAFVFIAWSTILIVVATSASPTARRSSWYDVLQIDVSSATVMEISAANSPRVASVLPNPKWLYIGAKGTDKLLYDSVSRRSVIFSAQSVVIVLQ